MNLNVVTISGRLTKDVEVRDVGENKTATLGLALNRVFTSNGEKKEETCFIDVDVWGKQAELAGQYLHKGDEVGVVGRLKQDSWEDKESGKKVSKIKVVANEISFGSKKGDGERTAAPASSAPAQDSRKSFSKAPAGKTNVQARTGNKQPVGATVGDDEIPF